MKARDLVKLIKEVALDGDTEIYFACPGSVALDICPEFTKYFAPTMRDDPIQPCVMLYPGGEWDQPHSRSLQQAKINEIKEVCEVLSVRVG